MRPWTATVTPIPSGLSGTKLTLDAMEGLVASARQDPNVVQTAQAIVRKVPEKNAVLEAEALLTWVRNHVRYTRDPIDVETVKSPTALLQEIVESSTHRAAADCDDQVVLLAALLSSIGYGTRFVAYRADADRPADYSHVALEAQLPGAGIVTLDPIMREWRIGEHVPDAAQFGPPLRSKLMSGLGAEPEAAPSGAGAGRAVLVAVGLFVAWRLLRRTA